MSKEKDYENCPVCSGEWGGKGKRYSEYQKGSQLLRKYFKCCECGHTWSQDFRPEQPIVSHHEVNLETRLPDSQNKPTRKRSKSQQ